MPCYGLSESGPKQEPNIVWFADLCKPKAGPASLFPHVTDFLQKPGQLSRRLPHILDLSAYFPGVSLNSSSSVLPFSFCSLNWMLKTLSVLACVLSLSHPSCDNVSSLAGESLSYSTLCLQNDV